MNEYEFTTSLMSNVGESCILIVIVSLTLFLSCL